jgi:glutathione S-transferase
MKLYYSPGACSLAPHIILRETRLPFELSRVDLETHRTQAGADFHGINSKGSVPVLELDDGERLTEGPIIAQYLGDLAGRADLVPAPGTMARYRVLEWQNYITSELHKSFSPLFNPAFDAAAKSIHAAGLRRKFAWVSERLSATDYLTGSRFTAADAYLFVVAGWAGLVDLDLSGHVELKRFMARVAARPAVREALQAERPSAQPQIAAPMSAG